MGYNRICFSSALRNPFHKLISEIHFVKQDNHDTLILLLDYVT